MEYPNNKQTFGIDISDSSVKVLALRKEGRKIRPISINEIIFPRGVVIKDIIKDKETLVKTIKNALRKAKPNSINTPYAIASLPESKCFIRIISLPQMEEMEIAKAIRWEAEQHIPLSSDQVYSNWKQIKTARKDIMEQRTKILYTAVKKGTGDDMIEVFKNADLKPIILEPESMSVTRSMIDPSRQRKLVLIADLGTNRTSFIIHENDLIKFTSSISVAGVDITNNIAEKAKLSFEDAEKTKIENGIANIKQKTIYAATVEIVDKIIINLKRTIEYYNEYETKKDIEEIILCGGSAKLKGLKEYAENKLKIPASLANPWINIYSEENKEKPPISPVDSLGFATVIGLAMRGIKTNND